MKENIIYLTGMSINKKLLNIIYKHLSKDEDFESIRRKLVSELKTKPKDILNLPFSRENIRIVLGLFGLLRYIDKCNMNLDGDGMIPLLPLFANITLLKSKSQDSNLEEVISTHQISKTSIDTLVKAIESLHPIDLFNIYLSNQSDTRSISSLSKKNGILINYGYSDKPFYENRFIDHVIIKLSEKHEISSSQFNETCLKTYFVLSYTIILYKVFNDDSNQDINKFLFGNIDKNKIPEFKRVIANQNIFGVALLSSILYKIRKDILTGPKIKFYISEPNNTKREFIEEAFWLSACPLAFESASSEEDADIILSGKFIDSEKDLNTTGDSNNLNDKNQFRIPIKMFFSLPIDIYTNENQTIELVSRNLIIPKRLSNSLEENMQIITVGGAEHNRGLARLINFHREEQKGNRKLGFIENMFDMSYKNEGGDIFLFGLNQPVSFYSNNFDSRIDNLGNLGSMNNAAKLIYFSFGQELENKKIKWHIMSIHGFSALSSAHASLLATIRMKMKKKKSNNKLFIKNAISDELQDKDFYIEDLCFIEDLDQKLNKKCNMLDYNCFLIQNNKNEKKLADFMLKDSLKQRGK